MSKQRIKTEEAKVLDRVYDPLNDGISEVQLIEWGGSPVSIVNAARISHDRRTDFVTEIYDVNHTVICRSDEEDFNEKLTEAQKGSIELFERQSLSQRDKKLTRYLFAHEHGSPFESSYWEVRVKLPIFVFRHLVRHRHISPNEISARYVEMKEEFYQPTEWRVQAEKNHQSSVRDDSKTNEWHAEQTALVNNAYQTIYDTYKTLLKNGVAREMARIILPLGLYTEVVMRGNIRSLLHLMSLRDSPDTQEETRFISRAIYAAVRPVFRDTLEIWEEIRRDNLVWGKLRELAKENGDLSVNDLLFMAQKEVG